MAMTIKNNIAAVKIQNILNANSTEMAKSLKKVSTGMKINSAGDDAAGWAISERMRAHIRSLEQSSLNAQNAASMMNVAAGAVGSTVDILRTLKEKCINAANDTNTDSDRRIMQKEFDQLVDQINDNAYVTYNDKTLIDGSHNNKIKATATVFANNYIYVPEYDPVNGKPQKMTDLMDRNGQNLGILETDNLTISLVQNGKTYTRTYKIGDQALSQMLTGTGGGSDFKWDIEQEGYDGGMASMESKRYYGYDGAGNKVGPADNQLTWVITVETKNLTDDPPIPEEDFCGLPLQLGGITFSVSDRDGNVKTDVNAKLNQFHEVLRAQNASEDNAFVFQIGSRANQSIKVGITDMRAYALGIRGNDGKNVNICTKENANAAIEVMDNALSKALDQQTTIGAVQNRLECTINNLTTTIENERAAESVIRDADIAKEMTSFTKHNILMQAAQAMLSQANQQSSSVLSLLP